MSLKYRFFIISKEENLEKQLENMRFTDKSKEHEEIIKAERKQLDSFDKVETPCDDEEIEKWMDKFESIPEENLSDDARNLWQVTRDSEDLSHVHIWFSELPFNEDYIFGYFTYFRMGTSNVEQIFLFLLKDILNVEFIRISYSGISDTGNITIHSPQHDEFSIFEPDPEARKNNTFSEILTDFDKSLKGAPSLTKFHNFVKDELSDEKIVWEHYFEIRSSELIALLDNYLND